MLLELSLALNVGLSAFALAQTLKIRLASWHPDFKIKNSFAWSQYKTNSRFSGKDCFVTYIDVDDLKTANEKWGIPQVNEKLRSALSVVRQADFYQVYSGDEFILVADSKATPIIITRLQKSFQAQGLTFTHSTRPVKGKKINEAIIEAYWEVSELKQKRIKIN